MISEKASMFTVPLRDLPAEESLPFPLFIHLPLNKRYVPVRLSGEPIGNEKIELFVKKGISDWCIPESFRQQYDLWLEEKNKPAEPGPEPVKHELSEPDEDGIYEETEIVSEVLQDEELSTEAKAEILSALGQDLLRSFNQISNRGKEAQAEAVRRGRQIADEILAVAAQNSNIYDEILALRQSKQDIEHSIMVSTLSVMFGLAMGLADETILADMATAGLFHDVGLTRVDPRILAKPEKMWSASELLAYQGHVQGSLDVLKAAGASYSPAVYKMISQHHENYDGSGFPQQIKGAQIEDISQLLHLANWFDRLSAGKIDGAPMSPAESLDKIFEVTVDANTVKEVQPELVQRVFQFMLEEKEAAENLLLEAQERAEYLSESANKGGEAA